MKKLVGILVLAAAGSSAAAQAPADAAREAALTYWTSGYAGAELAGAVCAVPRLPSESASSAMQRNTAKAIRSWRECHRRLMDSLGPEAAYKHIPADLFGAMTPAQRDAATSHVAAVHAQLADAVQAKAARLIASQDAWRVATRRYLDDYQERVIVARSYR
ncbi:hypothetical protein [Massilia alkalitolerans]|jgi:hypothetical protein|uniref:hypothetical protein n=1 Tax=Massilia alkalitolerans TaxID=286638 RepID=UPI0004063837|nr:hypothetical protein [Massilia alkalitolerans]